jgi:hypothetical protein
MSERTKELRRRRKRKKESLKEKAKKPDQGGKK